MDGNAGASFGKRQQSRISRQGLTRAALIMDFAEEACFAQRLLEFPYLQMLGWKSQGKSSAPEFCEG